MEVAKTVLKVADVAWTAMECCYHLHHHHKHDNESPENHDNSELEKELETLKSGNRRLRNHLEQKLKLLNNLSESPALLKNCPPDVTDEMVPSNVEEWTGIDDENYIVVSEEHVVDEVANFMAKCILSNPKAQTLTPEELQKTLLKALGVNKLEMILSIWHAGEMFHALATWGLALAGLHKIRAIVKFAAMAIHTTSKVVKGAL